MDGCADEDYAAACASWGGCFAVRSVLLGRGDKSGESSFESVVAAENIDVDNRFECIRAELVDGGKEVARCTGAAYPSIT